MSQYILKNDRVDTYGTAEWAVLSIDFDLRVKVAEMLESCQGAVALGLNAAEFRAPAGCIHWFNTYSEDYTDKVYADMGIGLRSFLEATGIDGPIIEVPPWLDLEKLFGKHRRSSDPLHGQAPWTDICFSFFHKQLHRIVFQTCPFDGEKAVAVSTPRVEHLLTLHDLERLAAEAPG